jgi:hypothetical protein
MTPETCVSSQTFPSATYRFCQTKQTVTHIKNGHGHIVYGSASSEILPIKGHEFLEGEKYSSTLSLNSALDANGWSTPLTGRFILQKGPGTHCAWGWVGSRASQDGHGKVCPHQDSNLRPSRRLRIAIPTTLPQTKFHCLLAKNLENPIRNRIFNSTSQYLYQRISTNI